MSQHTIQQRNAFRTARSRNHPRVVESEWNQPSQPALTVIRPRKPTRWHRFVDAAWRAHDTGMRPVWLSAGLLVLAVSLFMAYGIGACLFGWPL